MQTYNRLSLGFNSHNIAYLLSVWAAAQSLQGISIRRSTSRSLNSAPSPSLARRLARQFLLGRVHLCSQAFEALSYPVVLEHRRSLCSSFAQLFAVSRPFLRSRNSVCIEVRFTEQHFKASIFISCCQLTNPIPVPGSKTITSLPVKPSTALIVSIKIQSTSILLYVRFRPIFPDMPVGFRGNIRHRKFHNV